MKKQIVRITVHSLCIMTLAILFCKVVPYDPANMPNFGASIDRDITDFYNMVANKRLESKCDTNVVLVDIGLASRLEIADALDLINDSEPLAIGLDVLFDNPKDESDSALIEEILSIPNLVVASSFCNNTKSFFDELIPLQNKGFAELGDKNQVIRNLFTDSIIGADTLRSFASQIISSAGLRPQKWSNNGDIIIFPSIEYDTLRLEEIEECHDRLKGKLVLVGSIADNEDVFYTPTDMRMNGVCIHAHILSTMLSDKNISYLRKPIQWTIAFVIIFILILLRVYFMFCGNPMGDFLTRMAQLFVVWLFVYVSYLLFIHFLYYCDLSIALLSCISLLVADAWQAGLYIFNKTNLKYIKLN